MKSPFLRRITLSLTALLLPVAMLSGMITSSILKTTNPANTDITAGLAYLTEILATSAITFCVIALAIAGLLLYQYQHTKSLRPLKFQLLLFAAVLAVVLTFVGLIGYENTLKEARANSWSDAQSHLVSTPLN